jgi:Tfp pilus assembly protein PilN
MAKIFQINLLTKGDFSSSPLGQTLIWVLGVGRWIVITTQLIVVSAFLSRFYLDMQISDLGETITQKQAIVNSFTNFENQFRQTQSHLKIANQIFTDQIPYPQILDQINTSLPSDAQATSIKIEDNQLTISASALLDKSVDLTISNLEKSHLLKNVRLSKISLEPRDIYLEFEVQADISPA